MELLTKIWDTIERASYQILIPASFTLAVLLFTPTEYAIILGINKFSNDYKVFIGPAFLGVISLLIVKFPSDIFKTVSQIVNKKRYIKECILALSNLTPEEKGYLLPFIEQEQTAIYVGIDDGIISSLQLKKIVILGSKAGSLLDGFAFILQPWAREHLNKHPECLLGYSGKPLKPRETLYRY
jgi:hypothetical protein